MAQPTRTLSLRILSPAVELGDGMDMADVPIDTTIGALKLKLMELLPSHPTPDRMRLIHFGRLLANENDTLAHLFGEAALTQTTPFTLHLVVRAPPTPMETAATRQPPFAAWAPPTTTGAQPVQPDILPPGTINHPLMRPGATFVPQPQGATATPPHPAAPTPPVPAIQHAGPHAGLLQRLMEQQQQQMRQLHAHHLAQDNRPQTNPPPQLPHNLLPGMQRPTPPQSAPQTPAPFAHPHAHPHLHHHPHLHAPGHLHPHPPQTPQQHQQQHQQQQQQQQHRHATITINQSTVAIPMPFGPNGMPVGQIPLPGFPPMHSMLHQAARPQMQQFNPASPTVYLLSSPAGPQALLFSPQGTYTASLPHAPISGMPGLPNPLFAQTRPHTPAAQGPPPPGFNPPPVVVDPQQPPEQIAQQIVQQMNQGGAENQEFNALAPWQPLLAQGWMLLRLLFFAWILLGTGQGWRRPLALLAIGVVFWAINAGGIGNTVRDAVRSWWEAVVGLPGQPQQQEQGAIRQALRPAERLLALLIASLWPGVGERTVIARREAEERQRREEGERQTAEAERQRQSEGDQSTAQDTTGGEASESNTTIADQTITTATGIDASTEGQELRERKATIQASSSEQSSAAEPALTREEQHEQRLRNLTADW
ncbi:hypothetical protein D6C76_08137 [Aureobasidium pullulans]|nr:hypothetical protein D6C76_08137 [Aureobasidium pullulans]